jgi:hypothetical protein
VGERYQLGEVEKPGFLKNEMYLEVGVSDEPEQSGRLGIEKEE